MKYVLRHKANFDCLEGFLSGLHHLDTQIDHILDSSVSPESSRTALSRVGVMANTPSSLQPGLTDPTISEPHLVYGLKSRRG